VDVKFDVSKSDLPFRNYPIFKASTAEGKFTTIVLPNDLFTKLQEYSVKKDDFIITQFAGAQVGTHFEIYIIIEFKPISDKFYLRIDEDFALVPIILENHHIFFISQEKFQKGPQMIEVPVSTQLTDSVNALQTFHSMKNDIEQITSNRTHIRVFHCPFCTSKGVFSSNNIKCPFCKNDIQNLSTEGDVIL
jgi:hypothetical protein